MRPKMSSSGLPWQKLFSRSALQFTFVPDGLRKKATSKNLIRTGGGGRGLVIKPTWSVEPAIYLRPPQQYDKHPAQRKLNRTFLQIDGLNRT